MRIKIYYLTIIIFVITCHISAAQEYDFRQTQWGMSKKQVKTSEKTSLIIDEPDHLSYHDDVTGIGSTQIAYIFVNDELARATYAFLKRYADENAYINNYFTWKETLTDKYGKPLYDKIIWKGETYKDDSDKRGLAVVTGELIYFSEWGTPDSEIRLYLGGKNNEPEFLIIFNSKAHDSRLKNMYDKKNK